MGDSNPHTPPYGYLMVNQGPQSGVDGVRELLECYAERPAALRRAVENQSVLAASAEYLGRLLSATGRFLTRNGNNSM